MESRYQCRDSSSSWLGEERGTGCSDPDDACKNYGTYNKDRTTCNC
jgi:hypothetical protein